MKKILFVGNGGVHSIKWIQTALKFGPKVNSIGPPLQENINPSHIAIESKNIIMFYTKLFFKVHFLYRKLKPNYVFSQYVSTYGIVAGLLTRTKHIPLVIGSDYYFDTKIWIRRVFIKYILKKSYKIITVSDNLKEGLMSLGINQDKIIIIPYTPVKEEFNENKVFNMKQISIETTKIMQNKKFIFATTRSLKPVYNNIQILQAINLIKSHLIGGLFIITGDGPSYGELTEFVTQNELGELVYFPGRVPEAEKRYILTNSQFFISASISDGFPVSVQESLVYKLYPILSDIEANRAIFRKMKNKRDNITAKFFELHDDAELSQKILESLEMQNVSQILDENYNYAKNHFIYENIWKDKLGFLFE